MADINIPGVSNKYGTTETIQKLMEVERKPLTRAQEQLETYKNEQSAWRDVNKRMSALRENVRSLYSFDNPFSSKLAESSDENSVTASADRDAAIESFSIKVKQIATADRFLSEEIDKSEDVPAGKYTYKVNDKTVSFSWKGGKASDFVTALNRRGNNVVKASLISVSGKSQAMLIEGIKTGSENKLIFEDDALDFAVSSGMLEKAKEQAEIIGNSKGDLSKTKDLVFSAVTVEDGKIMVPPLNGFEIPIKQNQEANYRFTVTLNPIPKETPESISPAVNPAGLDFPSASRIQYKGIIIYNENPEFKIPTEIQDQLAEAEKAAQPEPAEKTDNLVVFVKTADEEIPLEAFSDGTDILDFTIKTEQYKDIKSIIIRNLNTEKEVFVTPIQVEKASKMAQYQPVNPITEADDAVVQYEGITMTRSDNKIDDIVPNVTLNLHEPSEKKVNISIKADTETAKDTLISMVGYYNQLMAEINILSQNKPEIITELDYLSADEVEQAEKKLGMFMADSTLSQSKTSIQRIISNSYPLEDSPYTMLSQIGIATNASSGSGSYNASRMRGYLEIDEKKLDAALENNIDAVKNLFGFDTDGDKIIDTGIAYLLDKNLQAYVQTGGVLALKTSTLDTRIKNTQNQVEKLETQLAEKENEYKRKYGMMEATLNSLNSQSDSITNFNNQNNKNK